MTYGVTIMYVVAAILGVAGTYLLFRLRSARISERQTYAYRMIGIMLAAAAIVLAFSASAMWRWSMPA